MHANDTNEYEYLNAQNLFPYTPRFNPRFFFITTASAQVVADASYFEPLLVHFEQLRLI